MDQLSSPPIPPTGGSASASPESCLRSRASSVGAGPVLRSRICPDAAPAFSLPVPSLDVLRAQIREIEAPPVSLEGRASTVPAWTLGDDALDLMLAGDTMSAGLDPVGVHEIKPLLIPGTCAAASRAVSLGFVLRLAVRRLRAIGSQASSDLAPNLVWCWPSGLAAEIGQLHGPGLAALGFDPARMLFVETARGCEALWAMEEALRSQSALLVVGVIDALDLTQARRLSLAAQVGGASCLLATHGRTPSAAATLSRWRIGLAPSVPHPLDPGAPGGFAATVSVERCRRNPLLSQSTPFALEWLDETHRFRMPSPLAHRANDRCRAPVSTHTVTAA